MLACRKSVSSAAQRGQAAAARPAGVRVVRCTATKARSDLAGVSMAGVAVSLVAAQQACAAQEVAMVAADNRLSTLALLFLPALGWVAFNILQPAFNQLTRMSEKNDDAPVAGKSKRR